MNPQKKQLARTLFQLRVHESNGFAYEHLFARVFQYSRPDFLKVEPYGNKGDRGNDGFEKKFGRYFQVFAPKKPSTSVKAAIDKVAVDFETKLIPHWGSIGEIKEYYFVFNDKYSGTIIDLEKTLEEIKVKHKLNDARVYLAKHLEDEFICLDEDQISMIVSGLPEPDSLEDLDYEVLKQVIQHIQNTPPTHIGIEKLVVPDIDEKIEFNGLEEFGVYLKAKQMETWQLDVYLERNSDFAKETLREHLAGYYTECLTLPTAYFEDGKLNGDVVFAALLEKIVPVTNNPAHDRLRREAALVIMAKYFEACDIFEEPANATA